MAQQNNFMKGTDPHPPHQYGQPQNPYSDASHSNPRMFVTPTSNMVQGASTINNNFNIINNIM